MYSPRPRARIERSAKSFSRSISRISRRAASIEFAAIGRAARAFSTKKIGGALARPGHAAAHGAVTKSSRSDPGELGHGWLVGGVAGAGSVHHRAHDGRLRASSRERCPIRDASHRGSVMSVAPSSAPRLADEAVHRRSVFEREGADGEWRGHFVYERAEAGGVERPQLELEARSRRWLRVEDQARLRRLRAGAHRADSSATCCRLRTRRPPRLVNW